jgi:hypothetical protein
VKFAVRPLVVYANHVSSVRVGVAMLPSRTWRGLTSLALVASLSLISLPATISHSTWISGLSLISSLSRCSLLPGCPRRSCWSRRWRRRRIHVTPCNQ